MTRKKEFGHKAVDAKYCQGYIDEHNHWNNGFLCPGWENAGGKVQYCCGSKTHRYCCIQDIQQQETETTQDKSVVIVIGVVVGMTVLIVLASLVTCYFVKYCPLYKRRKRHQQDYMVYDDEISATFTGDVEPGRSQSTCKDELPPAYPDVELKTVQQNVVNSDPRKAVGPEQLRITARGCIFRNPVALATERDSGCYVSPTDYDSQTCLTSHDILNDDELWTPQNQNFIRHSWPNQTHDSDVHRQLGERSETTEDVRSAELPDSPLQTKV